MSFTSTFPAFINSKTGVSSPFSLGGSIKDLKSSLKVSLTSTLPSGFAVVKAGVVIDKWLKTTNSAPTDVSWFFTNGNAKFIVGPTDSADVVYSNFVSGDSYRILFQVSVRDTNGATIMYQCAYKFNYHNPVPTFNNFTFNTNVASGDDINVTGLTLAISSPFPGDIPAEVSFEFNELELRIGEVNDENNNGYNPVLAYNPSGNYTLSSNELQNDNFYEVTAIISWESGYSTYVNSTQPLFVIARPSINDVVPYDAQNDGGNDGVHFNPPSSDIDTSDQIIATITLNPVGYENYLPSQVKFVFFDGNNNEIGSSDNAYDAVSTNLQSYNITLDSVILVNSSTPLLNGLPGYTVKAIVIVPIVIEGTTYPEQVRSSDASSVVFKQGVAPILPLTIGNTWDLVCNSNPSSAAALYNSSPVLGISGHFLKNAQFMSGYSRNLDNTATKFLLQYTLNGGAAQNVLNAALVQQGSEALQQTMINAMSSLVSSPNGQYVNVVGPSGVVGSSQNPLVFYIPKVQGSVTFGESDVVNVVVTIIDETSQWVDAVSGAAVSNTSDAVSASNGLIMVNKIATYSYTSSDAGSAMEPFIENVYSNSSVMKALLNNELIQVTKSEVIADSANIITQTANGWNVVNPAAIGTPLKVPKANLYYYAKGTSSSFTMGQVNVSSDLGMWYVINQNAGAKQYPFLIAYTTPTASGNAASWYKSKILYAPVASSGNNIPDPTQSGFTLLYTGNDDESLYPHIPASRRVKLAVNAGLSNPSSPNATLSSEEVNLVSIQTSSNAAETAAGDFNFLLRSAGVSTTSLLHGQYHIAFTDSSLMMTDNQMSLTNDSAVVSDSAQIITKSNKGWTVVNPAAIGTPLKVPKANLYYYAKGTSSSFTMGQVNVSSDLGMWYVINQNAGAKQYPFLIAYTTPTASGNAASWYKSKILYAPVASSGNNIPDPTQSGFTLLYTGNDDESLYPHIPASRRVKLAVNAGLSNPSSPNATLSSEEVNLVSIQTSSNAAETAAGDFNFTLLYAGVVKNGSYTTTLFTNPLLNVNIPIDTSFSTYSDNTLVNNINTPSGGFVISESNDSLSSFVLPIHTESVYNVQYSIKNPNNANAVVKGLVSADTTISVLNEPQSTDFTVSNFDYNTVNNDAKSSIVFDLTIVPYVLDRIDGVNVYFTSDSNSNISSTLIGTFTASQSGCEISLSSLSSWNPYTSATITFVPFRDNRVDSHVDETENLLATWTAPTVWNIPAINKPSVSGPITLTGGVVNSSDNTVLNWVNDTGSAYAYPVVFSYTLTMSMDSASANSVQYTTAAAAASAILVLAANTTNAYSLELKKVFNGQSSYADTIVFDSVKVDTSVMVVSVLNPSNLISVKASWVAPDITGTDSSFANNVASLCLTDNGAPLRTVTASTIETSGGSYSITNVMGTTLQLCMSVTAYVQYSINSGVSANSSTVSLPLGNTTQYTVSTVPNVALSTATSTVLIQDTATPSLLLNLDAKGLEVEGFISLVVVLTQDGTDAKPEGCEVLLQFPSAPTSSNPFLFPNTVGGAGSGSANLVGAESSTVAPLNLVPTNLSTNVGNYTLTIGSAGASGRYGLSSLTFPAGSGFANGQETNIMAILSSRRGTDIMVGSFTFASPPVASNVSVTTVNGQYVLSFNLA